MGVCSGFQYRAFFFCAKAWNNPWHEFELIAAKVCSQTQQMKSDIKKRFRDLQKTLQVLTSDL